MFNISLCRREKIQTQFVVFVRFCGVNIPVMADLYQHDVVELGVGKKCAELALGSSGKPVTPYCLGISYFHIYINQACITMQGLRENIYHHGIF